jgi:hypothetical protein
LRLSTLSTLVVISVLNSSPARAEIISFDSTSFALGVNVSHALDGATLQRLTSFPGMTTYTPTVTDVITTGAYWGPQPVTFGTYSWLGEGYEGCYNNGVPYALPRLGSCGSSSWSVLEVSFDAPTNYVQIVGNLGSDLPGLLAYSSDGSLLAACVYYLMEEPCTAEITGPYQPQSFYQSTLTVTSAQSDIAWVVYGGWFGTTTVHQISYNVPEPSTLSLLGLGAGVLTLSRRRRGRSRA